MPLYRQVVFDVDKQLQKSVPSFQGIELIRLPKPESLEADIERDTYHRLAVAWGLSYESFNIGKYDRPSESDDILPLPPRDDDPYIGKEQV